ncbi:Cof-type HAD-IIB family hydrolase [Bacillus sp. 03113]|uniref:Cof-type HAD-IIB family hydrolase n=1 Tax=Bacillus sp. 03113 TaxID=2578211 RepID=UPI001144729B|nr:Cof-type HAD-IIB family hydrolase [Bacillus sp. 03113]
MGKLIAIDMDGTLLNHENRISDKNLNAIKQAMASGIEIAIATGRSHFDVQEILKETTIKPWIIGANGATIHKPNGELFHSIPIDKQKAMLALKWLEKNEFYYEVSCNDSLFSHEKARELMSIEIDQVKTANPDFDEAILHHAAARQYSQSGFAFISSLDELLHDSIEIYSILAFSFHENKRQKGWEYFYTHSDITLVTSGPHNFELEHLEASKGNALEKLANELNISIDETIAMGDSMNDLSMITKAGRGIAMGNAREELKQASQEVTLTNNEDGVAHVIHQLVHSIKN